MLYDIYKTKQDREKKKRAEEDQAGNREQQIREEDTATTQLIDSELKNIQPVSTKIFHILKQGLSMLLSRSREKGNMAR
eukprot:15329624-Ditylum_brightwellii.AAC.1